MCSSPNCLGKCQGWDYLLNLAGLFLAAAERKGPAAGLEPGPPQDLVPGHLAGGALFVDIIVSR